MRNVRFSDAISRANSHFRYWKYRRDIGSPISLLLSVKQWIRRMKFEWHNKYYQTSQTKDCIDAIRARLEQKDDEPVAWILETEFGTKFLDLNKLTEILGSQIRNSTPLFLHPPAKNEPLDWATREKLVIKMLQEKDIFKGAYDFCSAVERAHGIGE